MKRLILTSLFVGVLLLMACGSPPAETITPTVGETSIPVHFITYTDEAGYFSISYPPDWEPFPDSMEGIFPSSKDFFNFYHSDVIFEGLIPVFTADSPREPGESGVNVNIVIQSVSEMIVKGWLTLDEIVEGKLQRTEEIKLEYHEFSRINTIIGGREAIVIDWESSFPDLGKKGRSVQMFMIVDKLVWKVTTYVDSEKYDYIKDDLYAIVESLRILK